MVRVTSNHLGLSGVPNHITFTPKVLISHNTSEVPVTSPQGIPVIHRLSRMDITTYCILIVSCLKSPLLLIDFHFDMLLEQQFCR